MHVSQGAARHGAGALVHHRVDGVVVAVGVHVVVEVPELGDLGVVEDGAELWAGREKQWVQLGGSVRWRFVRGSGCVCCGGCVRNTVAWVVLTFYRINNFKINLNNFGKQLMKMATKKLVIPRFAILELFNFFKIFL